MNNKDYHKAYSNTRLIVLPLASFYIIGAAILFYINSENAWQNITIGAALNLFYFFFLYYYVYPRLINSGSVFLIVIFSLLFTILSTGLYLLLFAASIMELPSSVADLQMPFSFQMAVMSIPNFAVYLSSFSIYLILNTYVLSTESYKLLQKSYQSEINVLRLQMNPHFISNSLGNLGHLIRKQDAQNAVSYAGKIIELIDEQSKFSQTESILLKDELEWLEYYMQMEQKRLNNFTYKITTNGQLSENVRIPPMLLQPVIENSVHHGFNPEYFKGEGHIHISIYGSKDNIIHIRITDNGIGNQQLSTHKSRPSISTKNIDSRINLINETGNFQIVKSINISEKGAIYNLKIEVRI